MSTFFDFVWQSRSRILSFIIVIMIVIQFYSIWDKSDLDKSNEHLAETQVHKKCKGQNNRYNSLGRIFPRMHSNYIFSSTFCINWLCWFQKCYRFVDLIKSWSASTNKDLKQLTVSDPEILGQNPITIWRYKIGIFRGFVPLE